MTDSAPTDASPPIEERFIEVEGTAVRVLERPGEGVPVVYLHGVPTCAEDWQPFLEAGGRAIAPDLPGFGRSVPRPGEATLHGYSDWFRAFLGAEGIERYSLVVHDWGGLALHAAAAEPDRIERLVVINAVPLLPGYRWHWVAQIWRRRPAGEIFNRVSTRPAVAALMRLARHGHKAMPREFVDMVWKHWSPDMSASILSLYRSADPPVLAAAGQGLSGIEAPAMVLWGRDDPYIPPEFGRAYADRLPGGELHELSRAGHWPWIDRPEVVARVTGFLAG